jgi:hypothetical protein
MLQYSIKIVVTLVLTYLNCATFSKDLLAVYLCVDCSTHTAHPCRSLRTFFEKSQVCRQAQDLRNVKMQK